MSETSRYTAAEVKVGRLFVGPPNAAGDLLVGTGIGSEYTQFAAGAPDQFLRVTPSGLNWTSVDLTDTTGSIGTSIITTGAAPAFQIRPLSASTGLSLSVVDGALTFANNSLLGSAGGGATLVATANAAGAPVIKSLIAGTGISLSSTDTDITITGDGGVGSFRWELQGTTVLKQKDHATVNNLLWQNDSAFPNQMLTTYNPTNCMLLGGREAWIEGDDYNTIIGGGDYNRIYREFPTAVGAVCEDNTILGGRDSEIYTYNDGANPTIARRNVIINAHDGGIGANSYCTVEDCGIFGGKDCAIEGTNTNTKISISHIFGGYFNSISASGLNAVSIYNTIVGGRENYMYDANENCTIVGGRRFEITNFSGCVMTGDNSFAAPLLTPSANNEYTARFAGGYRLFTDAGSTTGMTMAAGGSSWVAVSDVNKKDIHGEVDYSSYLEKLVSLPVYEYNYKGNPREQKCIGPTAQDYHALFGCECIEKEIAENVVVGERKIGRGEKERVVPIYEQVKKRVLCPAKDPLGIEQQDLIGICVAALKGLAATVSGLTATVNALNTTVNALNTTVNALDARLTALETA